MLPYPSNMSMCGLTVQRCQRGHFQRRGNFQFGWIKHQWIRREHTLKCDTGKQRTLKICFGDSWVISRGLWRISGLKTWTSSWSTIGRLGRIIRNFRKLILISSGNLPFNGLVKGSTPLWGVYKTVQNIDFLIRIYLSTSILDPQEGSRPCHFIKQRNSWPWKGLEGYLCPGINILGHIDNIETPFNT